MRHFFFTVALLFSFPLAAEVRNWQEVEKMMQAQQANMERYPDRIMIFSPCWDHHFAAGCDDIANRMAYIVDGGGVASNVLIIHDPLTHDPDPYEQAFIQQIMERQPAIFFNGFCLDSVCLFY